MSTINLKSAVIRRLDPRGKVLPVLAGGLSLTFVGVGQALAQAAAPGGSIGAQLQTMSSEGILAGGNIATFGCYAAALCTAIFGAWKLWQSRQPQNREQGHVMAGIAGLVLAGLFASVPSWVNKAAITTSGAAAGVNNTPGMIQFGGGGNNGG